MLFHFHSARGEHRRGLVKAFSLFVFLLLPEQTFFAIHKPLPAGSQVTQNRTLRFIEQRPTFGLVKQKLRCLENVLKTLVAVSALEGLEFERAEDRPI